MIRDKFDAYHKWLGIPPHDQPPHHYRLLGIELFEGDPDVISTAVDGRMALIKSFQSGKHSAESQQILNEIAAAKVCLLNPAKKEEYDRQLRLQLEKTRKRPPKAAPPDALRPESKSDSNLPHASGIPRIDTSPAAVSVSRRARKGSPRQLYLILTVAGLLVVGLLAFLLIRGNGASAEQATLSESASEESPSEPSSPTKTQQEPIVAPPSESPVRPPVNPPLDSPPGPPLEPVDPSAEPPLVPVDPPVEGNPDPPADDPGRSLSDLLNPADPGRTEPTTPKTDETDASKKLPVPNAEAQREAEKRIREIFKREFAEATTPDKKLSLAEDGLLAQARETAVTPTDRFVLMKLSCGLAAAAGDLAKSLDIAAQMCRQYELDALSVKAHFVNAVVESIHPRQPTKAESGAIVDTALRLVGEALRADNFRVATELIHAATEAVGKERDLVVRRSLAARVAERSKETRRLKLRFDNEVAPALAVLAENPDDAEANHTVGRWYCFSVDHWAKGLPLLAKGSDAELAALAKRDATGSDDPKQQKAIGDAWWSLAQEERGPEGRAMRARVVHWYRRAEPGLGGLAKKEVENRLRELESDATSGTAEDAPPGNVALASNGTTVSGVTKGAAFLLDGNSSEYGKYDGFAMGKWPTEWTITFNRGYLLQEIRFRLWDLDRRYLYRYAIEVSQDGETYRLLPQGDRRQIPSFGWQRIRFPPTRVKSIKLHGLHNAVSPNFHVVEFEAYCIPPKEGPR